MMRQEFPTKVKLAAFEACGGRCYHCDIKIRSGNGPHYDHRVPDALGGKPTAENVQVLCKTCHRLKTSSEDVPRIAKAKRVKAGHLNAKDKRRGFRTPPAGYDPWTRRMRAEP